jgi:hypothetical protein
LLDADADRADLELRLIKLTLKDRPHVHPFAGNGSSWRKAAIRPPFSRRSVIRCRSIHDWYAIDRAFIELQCLGLRAQSPSRFGVVRRSYTGEI